MSFLQPLLASALLSSVTPALALQTIEARDGVSVEASIALKEATRIKVDGANITEVFGNIHSSNCGGAAGVNRDVGSPLVAINPAGEIFLECDKDKGEIYVKPVSAGAKPVNLFISTAKSTYTLILKRVDMPADTIVLKDRALQQAATRFERSGGTSPSHVRSLKQMLTAMASDRVGADMVVEEVNRPVQLWTETRFTMLRLYESRGLIGEKYLLTNISNEPQTFFGSVQTTTDAQGRKFEPDSAAAFYLKDSKSLFEKINPGNSVTGTVVFDIPKDATLVEMELHDGAFSGGVKVKLA